MFSDKDRSVLRNLAQRVRTIAEESIQKERENLWRSMNDLRGERPMVMVSPEGAWREIHNILEWKCVDPVAHDFEKRLRETIYHAEEITDDTVTTTLFQIPWIFDGGNYGVSLEVEKSDYARGAYKHIAPISDLDRDLDKLRFRKPTLNRPESERQFELAQETFGDILDVEFGSTQCWWTTGLSMTAISMIGLEELMLTMYDNPEGLHRLMGFLRDEMHNYMFELEKLGVLAYNNGNNSVGSGNWGVTSDLPSRETPSSGPVRLKDMWGFCESQETVGVSPDMFAEFIWPYQKPLMELFGLSYYGCCEAVEQRFTYISQVENLRCISVSPWSDIQKCAQLYQDKYVLCRKPNPSLACVSFDEKAIRKDLSHTFDVAGKLNMVVVLKDTHTISNEPQRFKRWVTIVRDEINEHCGWS